MINEKILLKNHVTKGNLISNFYFSFIYLIISNMCDYKNKKVLDFGGGLGFLKDILIKKGAKVKIYDKVKELSEMNDYKKYKFDIVIFCQVLMYIKKKDAKKIFSYFSKLKNFTIISCFSTQTLISKIIAHLLNHKDPHADTVLSPPEEEKLIKLYFEVQKSLNFYLFKVILAKTKY